MLLFSLVPFLAADPQTDKLTETLVGWLPILLFLGVLYLMFRRQSKSPAGKLIKDERERHIQHMQKMEELAERIAKALEKRQ